MKRLHRDAYKIACGLRRSSLRQLAYALVIVGGIVMIILGLLSLVGTTIMVPLRYAMMPFGSAIAVAGIGHGIMLILGVVAIVGSRRATEMVWAIVLIVIGYIGGGFGGLLVLLGGILGLLSRFVHSR